MDILHCGNLTIFLPLWFQVKSILAYFKRSKTTVLTILTAYNFYFWKISHLKRLKVAKTSKFRAAQMVKMAVFVGSKWPKLILHKIWMVELSWNFHIVYSQLGCPSLYNLRISSLLISYSKLNGFWALNPKNM